MHIARVILLFTGAAVSALVRNEVVSSKVNCRTALGPYRVQHVSTVTSTSTFHLRGCTTTVYVPATVTARRKTRTAYDTTCVTVTTTKNTVTDTYTSTTTATDSITNTITTTETDTQTVATSTTTTSTSTVAAPSNFVPVTDTQTNGFPSRKRRDPKSPANGRKQAAKHKAKRPHGSNAGYGIGYNSQYAQRVLCLKTVYEQRRATVTATDRGCTKTIKPRPITKTITRTITSTSTEVPRASTTVTTTETTTVITSTTETETTTTVTTSTTTATATAVVYAACGADNFISSFNGQAIVNAYNNGFDKATIFDFASATSAEDCCIQCINSSGCQAGYYSQNGDTCFLLNNADRTCTSQSAGQVFFTIAATSGGYTVSNGLCGYNQYSPGP